MNRESKYIPPNSFPRDKICSEVKKKCKLKKWHVNSVINILIDELKNELSNGTEINIINLGKFSIEQPSPVKFVIFTKKEQAGAKSKELKVRLSKKLKKIITKEMDK